GVPSNLGSSRKSVVIFGDRFTFMADIPTPEEARLSEEIKQAIHEVLRPYLERHEDQLKRIFALLDLELDSPASVVMDDVLLAAVVLVEATLEDFLRSIAQQLIPSMTEKFLERVRSRRISPNGSCLSSSTSSTLRRNPHTKLALPALLCAHLRGGRRLCGWLQRHLKIRETPTTA